MNLLERYDDAVVITDTYNRWHFGEQKHYELSTSVQTNLRHKLRSYPLERFFWIEQPDDGCAVVLGVYPFSEDKEKGLWKRGLMGYVAYVFECGQWHPLELKKWIDVWRDDRPTIRLECREPKLGLRIDSIRLDLPADIVLDFWAEWLTVADVMAIHQELNNKIKFKRLRQALELTKELKSVLGIKSKTGFAIQRILEDVISTL